MDKRTQAYANKVFNFFTKPDVGHMWAVGVSQIKQAGADPDKLLAYLRKDKRIGYAVIDAHKRVWIKKAGKNVPSYMERAVWEVGSQLFFCAQHKTLKSPPYFKINADTFAKCSNIDIVALVHRLSKEAWVESACLDEGTLNVNGNGAFFHGLKNYEQFFETMSAQRLYQ